MFANRNSALGALLIFSLAFNAAFAGIFAYYLMSGRTPVSEPGIDMPLETEISRRPAGHREGLRLSAEQQEILSRRRERLWQELAEGRKKARELQREFISLLEDPDSDTGEIARVAEEFDRSQQHMRRMLFEDLLYLREMLDEEQRKSLGRMLKHRHVLRTPHTEGSRRTRERRPTAEEEELLP